MGKQADVVRRNGKWDDLDIDRLFARASPLRGGERMGGRSRACVTRREKEREGERRRKRRRCKTEKNRVERQRTQRKNKAS